MSSSPVRILVRQYRQALRQLDALRSRLSVAEKHQYQKLKARFEAQLAAWENMTITDLEQIKTNLQEGYNEMEAIWYNAYRAKPYY